MASYGQGVVVGREKGINGVKAKTRQEREIVRLRDRLPSPTPAQTRWMENLFEPVGYLRKSKIKCACCGKAFDKKADMSRVTCPQCGKKLDIVQFCEALRNRLGESVNAEMCVFITNINQYTIFRAYQSLRVNKKGHETEYVQREVFEIWIDDNGKEKIFSADYSRGTFHFAWLWDKPWKFAKHNAHATGYYVFDDVYDIAGCEFYGRIHPTKKAKRNGLILEFIRRSLSCVQLSAADALKHMLNDRRAEEFAKTGQVNILDFWINRNQSDIMKRLYAIHICNRNGYIIPDASNWLDHLDLLEYFGKDTHNAKYICPKNLNEEHLKLVKKKMKIEEIERAKRSEDEYQHYRKKYFNIVFGTKDISISVLKSVKEFYEEGKEMHHCVFANAYYDHEQHPDSLILSARDSEGNRIETIEVNIKTRKVVQSRGKFNSQTAQHKMIVDLTEKFFRRKARV